MPDHSAARGGRIPTGVPGLDAVLHGGFLSHGVYILIGPSGAGKTTLANQIAFAHAATSSVRYVTVLAETHTRLLGQIGQFAFYDPALVGTCITYLSGYAAFQAGSYTGLLQFLLPLVRIEAPALLVIDGLPLTTPGAVYDPSLKNLIHDLQVAGEFGRCTILILSPAHTGVWESRALMLVDGALEVTRRVRDDILERRIQVQIFRGGTHQPGNYPMTMDPGGVVVQAPPTIDDDTPSQ